MIKLDTYTNLDKCRKQCGRVKTSRKECEQHYTIWVNLKMCKQNHIMISDTSLHNKQQQKIHIDFRLLLRRKERKFKSGGAGVERGVPLQASNVSTSFL